MIEKAGKQENWGKDKCQVYSRRGYVGKSHICCCSTYRTVYAVSHRTADKVQYKHTALLYHTITLSLVPTVHFSHASFLLAVRGHDLTRPAAYGQRPLSWRDVEVQQTDGRDANGG